MSSQQAVPESKITIPHPVSGPIPAYKAKKRLYYLDWLKVLVVLGVFYSHVGWLFDILYNWKIESNSKVYALIVFGSQWGMALIFLLAGAGAWFSLGSRTGRMFLRERFVRLMIPFLVGVILIAPIQAYLIVLSSSSSPGSFLEYCVQFVSHIQLNWSPQSLTAYGFHLWFLPFLFLFSLLALPLFFSLRRDTGRRFISWLAAICERWGGIFILIFPLALIQTALRASFPAYQGWTDFFSWFVFFVYGYLFVADQTAQSHTMVIRNKAQKAGGFSLGSGHAGNLLQMSLHRTAVRKVFRLFLSRHDAILSACQLSPC